MCRDQESLIHKSCPSRWLKTDGKQIFSQVNSKAIIKCIFCFLPSVPSRISDLPHLRPNLLESNCFNCGSKFFTFCSDVPWWRTFPQIIPAEQKSRPTPSNPSHQLEPPPRRITAPEVCRLKQQLQQQERTAKQTAAKK